MSDMTHSENNRHDPARRQTSYWRLILLTIAICGLLTAAWFSFQRILFQPSLQSINTAIQEGKNDIAKELSEQYVVQNPDDVRGWLVNAEIAELAKDFRKAATAYTAVVSLRPDQIRYRHQLAKAQLQSAQFAAAELSYREILERNKLDEKAQTEIQWMLFHQHRVRELEDFLEQCLIDDPASPRLLFHLLMISQKPPNPFESLPVLEKIDLADPGQPGIQAALARCVWRAGDVPRARKLFAMLQIENGNDRELILTLAEFELEQTNVETAERLLSLNDNNKSIEWSKDDRWWWLKAQILQNRRQYPEALEAVTEASRLRPREGQYLQTRLSLLRILGRADEAAIVQAELELRRTAVEGIYQIVSRGGLNEASATVLRDIARHCQTLKKSQQANGWDQLSAKR
jgi:tetratricopeptide (TPR) repeat protein